MLLFYETSSVFPLLKKTESLCFVRNLMEQVALCFVEQTKQNEEIQKTFAFIPEAIRQLKAMQAGEKNIYETDFGIRAIFECYQTKPFSLAFFETHKEFVDFQMVLEGEELFIVGDKSQFNEKMPYDSHKDLIEYEQPKGLVSMEDSCLATLPLISLFPNSLAIFMPEDVHAGGLMRKQKQSLVRKCVLKVPTKYLKLSL